MRIGVLGAGQLGRMLALSAYPLGHQMRFLALSKEDPSSLLGKTFVHLLVNGCFRRHLGAQLSIPPLHPPPVLSGEIFKLH